MKKILGILLLLIAINTKAQTSTTSSDTTITVKVKGLTCKNDLATIANVVKETKGVTAIKVGKLGATSSYKITYNAAILCRQDIVAVIENTPGCGDGDEKPYKVKKN
jgi:copper chaperone CopZ